MNKIVSQNEIRAILLTNALVSLSEENRKNLIVDIFERFTEKDKKDVIKKLNILCQ